MHMNVMSSKALDSFDSESVRDAFHTRSATKLIIAQAKEEQTLVRTHRLQKRRLNNMSKLAVDWVLTTNFYSID